jgi:hypothetical protein
MYEKWLRCFDSYIAPYSKNGTDCMLMMMQSVPFFLTQLSHLRYLSEMECLSPIVASGLERDKAGGV